MNTRGNGTSTNTDRQMQEDARHEDIRHDETRFPQSEDLDNDVD